MDEITCITAKEVVNILYNSDMNVFMKIPPKFISFLETKANDCKDEIVISEGIGIENQSISDEAKAILAIIYKDFLVQKYEKERLEKELAEKAVSNIISEDINNTENNNASTKMIVYKEESGFKKILNKLKSFLSKK